MTDRQDATCDEAYVKQADLASETAKATGEYADVRLAGSVPNAAEHGDDMTGSSLQDKIAEFGSAYNMLYSSAGAVYQFPVRPEFANWRDQRDAWRKNRECKLLHVSNGRSQLRGQGVSELHATRSIPGPLMPGYH